MFRDESYIYDIFVSYASADDDRPAPHDRWIARFVEDLSKLLTSLLGGEKPAIFFDQYSLNANHSLDQILEACRRSKIFIGISSPAYQRREWTAKELETFSTANAESRALFLVEMDPVRGGQRLPQMTGRHIRAFAEPADDDVTHTAVPLKIGSEIFYKHLARLAKEVVDELERPGRVSPAPRALESKSLKGTVLLAQVTEDLEDERESVRVFLEQHGLTVLPRDGYPQGGEEFLKAVKADLSSAKLFIQLLGRRPGRTPRDLPDGYARSQAALARSMNTPILQWHRPDLAISEVTDKDHLLLLRSPEVVVSTLTQFQAMIVTQSKSTSATPRVRSDFLVFINAEKSDQQAAKDLCDSLSSDYTVVVPLTDSLGSIREDTTENIRDCDALLILYGQSGPDWVRAQLRHVRKARAGREPVSGAICLGPPPEKAEIGFAMPGLVQLDCATVQDAWNVESVRSLLSQLAQ